MAQDPDGPPPATTSQIHCTSFADLKGKFPAIVWTTLTRDQWQFLRGIYTVLPDTPPGLPIGDRAVLAKLDGAESGKILFEDGEDKVCGVIDAPKVLIDMLMDVGSDAPHHAGDAS
jgi:hypothetical protein